MSEIKDNIDKMTSLTREAANLQQELFVKEQGSGKNGYGNVVGGLQINRTNDRPNAQMVNMSKHVYRKNSPDSRDGWSQEAAGYDKQVDWWNIEIG